MATSRPSGRVARWTWPIDAAANGFSSNVISLLLQSGPNSVVSTFCKETERRLQGSFLRSCIHTTYNLLHIIVARSPFSQHYQMWFLIHSFFYTASLITGHTQKFALQKWTTSKNESNPFKCYFYGRSVETGSVVKWMCVKTKFVHSSSVWMK